MRPGDVPALGRVRLDEGAAHELAELYRRYAPTILASLRRRFGADEAEELLQEAFARLSRYRGSGAIQRPRALVMRIALNLARDRRRVSSRLVELDAAAELAPSIAAEQAETLLLKQVILQLPKPLQEVFVLSRFVGLTYPEIAERLNISPKTVEWRMSRALAICVGKLHG